MKLAQLIGPELERLVQENPKELRSFLNDVHPEDLADFVDDLGNEKVARMLRDLPTDYAAQVFERLDDHRQEALAGHLGVTDTTELAIEMDADERTDFLSVLPPSLREPVITQIETLDPEVADDVEELSRWEDTVAGGLMTTDYISVPPTLSMGEVINELRNRAQEAETIETVYVLEQHDRLVGVLPLRRILLAAEATRVDEVMIHNPIGVEPELDQEDVARKLAKYDLGTIPVIDKGTLLGVITSDDILDVLTEEQSEDVHKMGAIEPVRDGYFETSFLLFLKKRAPWLLILFLGGFIATMIMKAYDQVLVSITQLTVYLPLLISAGGNSGSQSSTLIIRSLAVGDVESSDWWRVFVREFGQGLVLGTMLATLGVARVYFAGDGIGLSALVGITIIGIVLMGCVVGGMFPLLLHRLGIDPATSSTPFIATLIDVLGIGLYLALANYFLLETMSRLPAAG
ncbi:MAG: magnesium transporter [Polyangiaceae bacterium]|nr:magnesium transporter [Polyangiaceae bacterium]